jgi:hypothetical protein
VLKTDNKTVIFTDQGEFKAPLGLLYRLIPYPFDPLKVVEILSGSVFGKYMSWEVDGVNYFDSILGDIYDEVFDGLADYIDSLGQGGLSGVELLMRCNNLYVCLMDCLTNFYHHLFDLAGNRGLVSQYVWTVKLAGDAVGADARFEFRSELAFHPQPLTGSDIDAWFQQ